MDIDKDQIQKIINQMEASEAPFYEACQMLKELINPKWEPFSPLDGCKYWYINGAGEISEYDHSQNKERTRYGGFFPSLNLAETARDMNKRNQLILQAKTEMGYGDGEWIISLDSNKNSWWTVNSYEARDNPELTFKTKEQAETVIKMVGLNES